MQRLPNWAARAARPAAVIVIASLFIVAVVGIPTLSSGDDLTGYEDRLQRFSGGSPKELAPADSTAELQAAIDGAAGGVLVLPDYPLLVSPPPGQVAALIIRHPITIRGSAGSVLRIMQGGKQLLRVENTTDVRLEGFVMRGIGGDGTALAHGLLQVTGASNVTISNLVVRDCDADGIAVSGVENVRITGCRVERASKSGIYLTSCNKALVSGNTVSEFGGHIAPNGSIIGTGIQLSSNTNLICSDNLVINGTGAGILCNANVGGNRPYGNVIRGNRISRVTNPTNNQVSSGIWCSNLHQNKTTHTVISQNSIDQCGVYGIYIENHGYSSLHGNTVIESERSGIVVSSIRELSILDNVILNSDASGAGGSAGIVLINNANGVVSRGNIVRNSRLYTHSTLRAGSGSTARGSDSPNDLEPRVRYGVGPPRTDHWSIGDRIYNSNPTPGSYIGWICTGWGTPGQWAPFGKIE